MLYPLTVLYTFAVLGNCVEDSLVRVIKSTVALEDYNKTLSGAKIVADALPHPPKSVTFCVRFNFKLLGGYEGKH